MRDVSCLMGTAEIKEIKTYFLSLLSSGEKERFEQLEKKMEAFIKEEIDDFFDFNEILWLRQLCLKYGHYKPFYFCFDPKEKMPQIYYNQTAFIIWTVWRSYHLRGQDDLEGACLAAAEVLNKSNPPYPEKIKKEAVEKFRLIMENTGYLCSFDLAKSFWEEKIFPYLEGKWEFKFQINTLDNTPY